MADFVSSLENRPIISSASSAGANFADHDDDFEDACSICLEPFNSGDPPTVTNCKHEYHLHCILEWSQRSKECPICWQLLVFKDPASQELLAAVENERNLRSRRHARHTYEPYEINHGNFYADDSDFDERIMRHFAAAARRARHVPRRGGQRSAAIGPSRVLPSFPTGIHLPDGQHMNSSPEEQSSSYEFSLGDSPTLTIPHSQNSSSVVTDYLNMEPDSVVYRDGGINSSHRPLESPQRPSSSEFLAFSESFKSKFSAASARYKESISKGTQGFKEKLLARNISVKELGRGVQREMNAGIAGVGRMFERLDLTSKRAGVSVPLSNCSGGTSNFSYKGKDMQDSEITQYPNEKAAETAHDKNSAASPPVWCTIPGQLEVHLVQGGN